MTPAIRDTLDPRSTALLICDVQNDFCSPGGKVFDRAAKQPGIIADFVRQIAELAQSARHGSVKVVFIRNTHLAGAMDVSAEHMQRLKSTRLAATIADVSCIAGSWGHQVVDALKPQDTDIVIDKSGFNIFQYSMVNKVLRAQAIQSVVLTGLSTYAGILATSFALMDYGYHFSVPRECVTGYEPGLHDAAMKILGPHLVNVADVVELWGR